jgi:hypothetical protein
MWRHLPIILVNPMRHQPHTLRSQAHNTAHHKEKEQRPVAAPTLVAGPEGAAAHQIGATNAGRSATRRGTTRQDPTSRHPPVVMWRHLPIVLIIPWRHQPHTLPVEPIAAVVTPQHWSPLIVQALAQAVGLRCLCERFCLLFYIHSEVRYPTKVIAGLQDSCQHVRIAQKSSSTPRG